MQQNEKRDDTAGCEGAGKGKGTGIVAALFRAVSKGVREEVSSARVSVENGFEGDIHTNKDKRQVVLFSVEGRNELEKLAARGEVGLCFARFKEDITTRGAGLGECRPGDTLQAGDVVLSVSGGQKKCYSECPFVEANLPVKSYCPLQREVVFADCRQGGMIAKNDIVRVDRDV